MLAHVLANVATSQRRPACFFLLTSRPEYVHSSGAKLLRGRSQGGRCLAPAASPSWRNHIAPPSTRSRCWGEAQSGDTGESPATIPTGVVLLGLQITMTSVPLPVNLFIQLYILCQRAVRKSKSTQYQGNSLQRPLLPITCSASPTCVCRVERDGPSGNGTAGDPLSGVTHDPKDRVRENLMDWFPSPAVATDSQATLSGLRVANPTDLTQGRRAFRRS